jgi:hypothetical protein
MASTQPDMTVTGGDMGGDGGSMCTDSGKVLSGGVYTWGPMDTMAQYAAGVFGNVLGCPNLVSPPSTNTGTMQGLFVPIPQEFLGDGNPFHTVELRGMVSGWPTLHVLYGPYTLDGSDLLNHGLVLHTLLDQPGNIRDTINSELGSQGITLGVDHSWIMGVFVDSGSHYYNEVVSLVPPNPDCTVYYPCDFIKGMICAGGPPYVTPQTDAFAAFFLVICKNSVQGPITLHSTDGFDINSTKRSFNDITVPLMSGPSDVTFAHWSPK